MGVLQHVSRIGQKLDVAGKKVESTVQAESKNDEEVVMARGGRSC